MMDDHAGVALAIDNTPRACDPMRRGVAWARLLVAGDET